MNIKSLAAITRFQQSSEICGVGHISCQVLGSQVSVILATYVTAFLRHWANAYI